MAAADAAPARPRVRLVLYSGKSDYKLEMIHDEYSIECEDGDAFAFAKNEWYAIGLEVDGQLQRFQKGENVCMRICDERDPDEGARILKKQTSTMVWKDGLHYFNALEWRQVGVYRVVFKITNHRRSLLDDVPTLSYTVRVIDPEWEAELAAKIEAEMAEEEAKRQRERERVMGYRLAPLNKRERSWLEERAATVGADPTPAALTHLALEMQRTLKTPAAKEASVLVPVFESEAARTKRVATEKQQREVEKRQRELQAQRMLFKAGGAKDAGAFARLGGTAGSGISSGIGAGAASAGAAGAAAATALLRAVLQGTATTGSGGASGTVSGAAAAAGSAADGGNDGRMMFDSADADSDDEDAGSAMPSVWVRYPAAVPSAAPDSAMPPSSSSPVAASSSAAWQSKPTVSSTSLEGSLPTVNPHRRHARKPAVPVRLASAEEYPRVLRIVRRWQRAQERLATGDAAERDVDDDGGASDAAAGSGDGTEATVAGRRSRPAASAFALPEGMPRIHRFEPLAAGQSNAVWCVVGASKALAAEWSALCDGVMARAQNHCVQELARLQTAATASTTSDGPSDSSSSLSPSAAAAASAPPAAVAALQSRLSSVYEQAARGGFVEIAGLSDTVAQLHLSAGSSAAGPASGSSGAGIASASTAGAGAAASSAPAAAGLGAAAGALAVPSYPLTAQQEYALLVDALDKTATAASLPRGFRHLWRFLACVHRVRAIRLAGGGTGSTAAVARRRAVA